MITAKLSNFWPVADSPVQYLLLTQHCYPILFPPIQVTYQEHHRKTIPKSDFGTRTTGSNTRRDRRQHPQTQPWKLQMRKALCHLFRMPMDSLLVFQHWKRYAKQGNNCGQLFNKVGRHQHNGAKPPRKSLTPTILKCASFIQCFGSARITGKPSC